jgi:hypothetical protein
MDPTRRLFLGGLGLMVVAPQSLAETPHTSVETLIALRHRLWVVLQELSLVIEPGIELELIEVHGFTLILEGSAATPELLEHFIQQLSRSYLRLVSQKNNFQLEFQILPPLVAAEAESLAAALSLIQGTETQVLLQDPEKVSQFKELLRNLPSKPNPDSKDRVLTLMSHFGLEERQIEIFSDTSLYLTAQATFIDLLLMFYRLASVRPIMYWSWLQLKPPETSGPFTWLGLRGELILPIAASLSELKGISWEQGATSELIFSSEGLHDPFYPTTAIPKEGPLANGEAAFDNIPLWIVLKAVAMAWDLELNAKNIPDSRIGFQKSASSPEELLSQLPEIRSVQLHRGTLKVHGQGPASPEPVWEPALGKHLWVAGYLMGSRPVAIVATQKNTWHPVGIGSYVGENWGKVTEVGYQGIHIIGEEFLTPDGELMINNYWLPVAIPLRQSPHP